MSAHRIEPSFRTSNFRCGKAVALALLGIGTWGCSLDFVPEENKPKPETDDGDLGAFVNVRLTGGAPSTLSLQSGVALNIAQGAVKEEDRENLNIQLERPRQDVADGYVALWTGVEKPLTSPHIILPYGLTFAEVPDALAPAILTLPLEGVSPSANYVMVLRLDDELDTTWEVLRCPAGVKNERAFVAVEQLGIFMLVESSIGGDAGLSDLDPEALDCLSKEALEDLSEGNLEGLTDEQRERIRNADLDDYTEEDLARLDGGIPDNLNRR